MPPWPNVPKENWDRAKEMRKHPTLAEHRLWMALRARQLGVTFRRQYPIGPYIVDFACIEAKIVVEVDGSGHIEAAQAEYDEIRDSILPSHGFAVYRFASSDVQRNLDGVLRTIRSILDTRTT